MNCREAEQLLDAYLEGELSQALRLEFDAHRLRCWDCQQKLVMMEACQHILHRDAHLPGLSTDFADRVMTEIASRESLETRARRRAWRLGMVSGVLSAAAALVAMIWMQPAQQPPEREVLVVDSRTGRVITDPSIKELLLDRVAAANRNLVADVGGVQRVAASALDAFHSNVFEQLFWAEPAPEREPSDGPEVYPL